MSESDRERCLDEVRKHETEISALSLALAELDRSVDCAERVRDEARRRLDRHVAYITAQVMRHRISVALLESQLATPGPRIA